MILPLNKYNLEDLSNTKFYKNITELGKTTLSTLDFQKYYPLTQIFAWKTINNKISKNHTLSDQFYMNLIPYLRTYSAGLWKKDQFLREFLDPILTFKCPRESLPKWHHQFGIALFFGFYGNIYQPNGVEGEITPLLYTTSIMQLFFTRRRHGEAGYAALDVYSKQAVH